MRWIVARVSGRIFVGHPLCKRNLLLKILVSEHSALGRNQDYLQLSIDFTTDVGNRRNLLACFPKFIRRTAAGMITNVKYRIEECRRFIEPIVLERLDLMDKLGQEWHDKPVSQRPWSILMLLPTMAGRYVAMDRRRSKDQESGSD